jgi:hypothetical protein
MAQLDVTELDFDNIKQSLKTFLSAQSEFSDYDFEGSALSVLLDTLAYNTHYNAMLAHMQANETFLDSAIKRSSVVSLAKSLGYTPRSRRAATGYVNFTLVPDPSFTNSTFSLSRDTIFTASVNGTTYNFYPSSTVSATLETINGVTGFVFNQLPLKEGTRVSNSFLIDASNLSGPITIPNQNVDTSTLRVRVQKSATEVSLETFMLSSSLLDLLPTSRVYFLEESIDGLYTLKFGDNVLGKQLTAGNIVIVDYITTNGVDTNGAKGFSCSTTLTGSSETKIFDTTQTIPAASGQNKESIDSIRRNAPKYNSAKERAVSAQDYESLILASNTNIQAASVWGGENNDPPIYGKVYISLDPIEGQIITDKDKDEIVSTVIGPKAPVAILPEFVDPIYTYIGLKVGIVYDTKLTTQTSGQISSAVSSAISTFFADELNTLNKNFYYSKIHDAIKSVSTSIVSVNITPTLQKRLAATLNASESYTFTFNSRIQPRELHSSWFNALVSTATVKVKLQDVPNANVVAPAYNGTGILYLVEEDGTQVANIGTIDYNTGKLTIPSMTVASLFNNETVIRVRNRPHDDSKDISTNVLTRTAAVETGAVFATPATNTILTLDDTAANITTGTRKGLEINVTAIDEGY